MKIKAPELSAGQIGQDHYEYLSRMLSDMPEEIGERMSILTLGKRENFIHESHPVDQVYILASGSVRAVEHRVLGFRYDYMIFHAVKVFGAMEILLDMPVYRTTLGTMTDCTFLVLGRDDYSYWIHRDINALAMETREMGEYLLEQSRKERLYLFLQGKDRLLMLISLMYREQCDSRGVCVLQFPREEWSDMTGLSLRTVGRAIRQISDEGFVVHERSRLTVDRVHYRKIREHLGNITAE